MARLFLISEKRSDHFSGYLGSEPSFSALGSGDEGAAASANMRSLWWVILGAPS